MTILASVEIDFCQTDSITLGKLLLLLGVNLALDGHALREMWAVGDFISVGSPDGELIVSEVGADDDGAAVVGNPLQARAALPVLDDGRRWIHAPDAARVYQAAGPHLDELRKVVLGFTDRGVHVRFAKENLTVTCEDSPLSCPLLWVQATDLPCVRRFRPG